MDPEDLDRDSPAAKLKCHFRCKKSLKKLKDVLISKKRLEQGRLHPLLEVPRLTFPGRESNPGFHCRGQAFDQNINCYSKHLRTYDPVTESNKTLCCTYRKKQVFVTNSPVRLK